MSASSSFDPMHPLKSLTVPRDALRPPSADSPRLGLTLSMVAHAGLLIALAVGVSWHTQDPEGVQAELWAAVPEIAAPRAQPQTEPEPEVAQPPPPPKVVTPPQPTAEEREADIAIEKARKEKLEKERQEALDQKAREKRQRDEKERKEQLQKEAEKERLDREKAEAKEREKDKLEEQRKEKAAAAAREKARQDQLRRMNDQLAGSGAPTSTGTGARDAGPSSTYEGRLRKLIRDSVKHPFQIPGNPTTEVRVTLLPDGTVANARVAKSSGNAEWDNAAVNGVYSVAKFPRDENGKIYSPMTFVIAQD